MLTLLEMANDIVSTVGQQDPVSLQICKQKLQKHYKSVWDSFFWRDSQMVQVLGLGVQQPFFELPAGMERIVSIGNQDGTFLDPVDETFLMESAPELLDATVTGIPQYYTEYYVNPLDPDLPDPVDPSTLVRKIRIYPNTAQAIVFNIFGKRLCPGFTNDNSTSLLRNCDNAIIAFAHADMLERARQYQKAQAKIQEAAALLAEAKSVESDQANRPRRGKFLTVAGNSLAEMTDAVCAICGSWTPDVRIIVKEFIRRNYVALYQSQLWQESSVIVRVAMIGEQIILPHYVDRVIAARTADGFRLIPNNIEYIFGVSPNIFEETGTSLSMSVLTPVGVAMLPLAPPEPLIITSNSADDSGKKVFIRGESRGDEVTEEVILADTPMIGTITTNSYDVPLTIAKPITVGTITVNGAQTTQLYQSLLPRERERKHQRIWLLPPPQASQTTTAPGVSGTMVDCSQGVLVLGKRHIIPLRTDEDTPIITGAQAVLIAGAAADLFTRLKDNDSAQIYRNKAELAAKSLVSENMDQAAYSPKFVPTIEPYALGALEDGYCWSKQ